MAYLLVQDTKYTEAIEHYIKLLTLDEGDDMAHVLLANALHNSNEDDKALVHHKKAIDLDDSYGPHYFNYANTLYDLKRYSEALAAYSNAYTLDSSLEVAQEMIVKLKDMNE